MSQQSFMEIALEEARKAYVRGEVPVGSVLVGADGNVLAAEGNRVEQHSDPTAHAEILAIRAGAETLGTPRLEGCDLYVTLEPCVMCAGAIVHARIAKLVYAVDDEKTGACGSVYNLVQAEELNHHVEVEKGILERQCQALIQDFFKEKRLRKT